MRHLAIIMDGNGRWAEARGLPRTEGHREGAKSVRRVLECCQRADIDYLTLYAFSVENWKRPKAEVDALMGLLALYLNEEEKNLHEQRVRLRVMGRRTDLSPVLLDRIEAVEKATAGYARQLILCLSYGGRTEIAAAAKAIAAAAKAGTLDPETIDERVLADYLYLPDVPDPDLIIRTSGELRLSNFLLWQAAYSEIYVTDTLWPDFGQADFDAALASYAKRDRRFGTHR